MSTKKKRAPREKQQKEPGEGRWCRNPNDHDFIYKGCKKVRGRYEVTYQCIKCDYMVSD